MKSIFFTLLLATMVLSPDQASAQDFWQPTNGPYAGFVNALAVSPDGLLFAGSEHGLFRSEDDGDTWTAINMGLTDIEILSIATNPVSGDIFVGTDGGGVFRSTTSGEAWTAVNTGLSNKIVQALTINANGDIFAGTRGGGAFRSTNNGASWTPINTGLTVNRIQALAINASGDIFAGTYRSGVFRSTDNGESWTQFLPGSGNNQNDIRALVVNTSGHIFAGTRGGGVFRSKDNGATWKRVSTNLGNPFVYALAINASGHIFAGTRADIGNAGVFRSTNNGDSWTKVSAGLDDDDVRALTINASGDVFAGTEGGGVFRTTDNGSNWFPANTGLTGHIVRAIAINASGHLFAGTTYGLFRSIDNGNTWARVPSGLTNSEVWALAINASGHIFAAPGPYRSTDNGDTWTRIDNGLPNTVINDIAINIFGHLFVATFADGIYRSTDNGDTWVEINNGLLDLSVEALTINSNGDIFAGTDGIGNSGIFRSTDFGDTWTQVNNGLPSSRSPSIKALAISPSNVIYAAETFDGVFRSTNNGDLWTQTALQETFMQVLATDSVGTVFAGSFFDGAFRSRDNGDSWTPINSGLPGKRVESFAIDANQFIFVGTEGGGVQRSMLPTTAISPPATPQLALPPDGATNRPTTLTLSWNASAEATTYHLQVSTDSDFTTTVVNDSAITATSRQVGPLANNTTYYWRVRAKNAGGVSAWSSVWQFTVGVAAPLAPTLLSPADGAIDQPTTLVLRWNPATSADSYRLQVSTSEAFSTTVFDDSTFTATSQQVGFLAQSTTYFWRVKAKNSAGSSAWSSVWRFTTRALPPPGTLKWAKNDLSSEHSPAIGADGTIYVVSGSRLYAVNSDGSTKWAFPTSSSVFSSSPAIGSDGTIYVGHEDDNLYAINPNGTQKWAFDVGSDVTSSPAVGRDGRVYVGTLAGRLYCIGSDAALKWTFESRNLWSSSPAIAANGTVYFGSGNNLIAVNQDGSEKWVFATAGRMSSPAIGADGTVYVGSADMKLYAIHPNGLQKWAFVTEGFPGSPTIGPDGTIYVKSSSSSSSVGFLHAINPDGIEKWVSRVQRVVDTISPATIGADGTIYFGSGRTFYALNPDGTTQWSYQLPQPTFLPTKIYSAPAIESDGTVYFASNWGDKKLYAIYSSSNGLATASWPKFRHDNRNSGRVPPANIDVGVSRIDIPSYVKAGDSTSITVVVGNFGTTPQSNFPVSYRINSGSEITEIYSGTLAPGEEATHTFATPWVPAIFGVTDTIEARTSLAGDEQPHNDGAIKTVLAVKTNIFCSTDAPKNLADNDTTISTLEINDDLIVGDLNVRLHIRHTYDSDLDVFLISPNGTKVELFSDIGSSGNHFGSTCLPLPDFILDDQATTNVADTTAPFIGSFRSEDSTLGTFHGENARGMWALVVFDDRSGSSGTLECWCLEIEQAPPKEVGITAIALPKFLELGDSLPIEVTVKNFGSEAQANFPISYSANDAPPVTENFSGTLEPGMSAAKVFTNPWQPTAEGTYRFTAWTALEGDANAANDTLVAARQVVVREANAAPILSGLGDVTIRAGTRKSIRFTGFDADADSVFFSIVENPGFLSLRNLSQSGDSTSATLVIAPSKRLRGQFTARLEARDQFDAMTSVTFTIFIVPRQLYAPSNLTAIRIQNGVRLGWDTPVVLPNSPYSGIWQGTTTQNLPVFMSVADDGFIDSLTVRLRTNWGGFPPTYCTGNFWSSGVVPIKSDSFDVFVSNPLTSVTTTLRGSFASDSTSAGKYDESSGGGFIYCGSNFIFVFGGTQLSAGTWQMSKTAAGGGTPLPVLTGYNIYRSSMPNARISGTLIASVEANATVFTDLEPGEANRYYQVTARYDLGESDPTPDAFIQIPTGISESSIPITYALMQNYPNPFNPDTKVRFQLPRPEHVRMVIYNIIGEEIRTLVDGLLPAGFHSVVWDGRDRHGRQVASGVYLYRMQAGEFVEVKRMLLLR